MAIFTRNGFLCRLPAMTDAPIDQWLAEAEEARALAEALREHGARLMMFRIAAAYENMARTAMARDAAELQRRSAGADAPAIQPTGS